MWIGRIGRPVSKVAIVRVDFPDDTIAVVLEGAEIAFAIGIVRGSEIVIGTNALQDCRLVFDRRAIAEFGDGLGEEAQHHPAEEGCPCHLRADQRSGKP